MLQESVQLLRDGRHAQAEGLLRRAVDANALDAQAWFLLGAACHAQGRPEAALVAFEQAAVLSPDHLECHKALAAVLFELKRPRSALRACNRVLALAPKDPAALSNTARVLEELGEFDAALYAYERSLAADPMWLPALLNRGALLARRNRLADALAANTLAVQLYPSHPACRINLAEGMIALGDARSALAEYEAALALAPHLAEAHLGRAIALAGTGDLAGAQEAMDSIERTFPGELDRLPAPLLIGRVRRGAEASPASVFCALAFLRLQQCNWERYGDDATMFGRIVDALKPGEPADPDLAFWGLAFPLGQPALSRLATGVAANIKRRAPEKPVPRRKRKGEPIRVGYVSPDFRAHPVSHLTAPFYELHDRRRFRITAYSLAPGDGSRVRERIEEAVDAFRHVERFSAAAIASLVALDEVDILVDLAGYTRYARPEIFAARPAPVQVAYLGYPNTLGADFLDYALVDHVVCPSDVASLWTEKLAFLPTTYYPCDNRIQMDPAATMRGQWGLPDSGTVLCCFNQSWRIEPRIFEVWMMLLRELPDAVLWLQSDDPVVQANLRREARTRHVSSDRLVFAPHCELQTHLARLRAADIVLDTLNYNAHTTAADALRAGVPVVTCPGETMQSRVAASLLLAAGLPELVARDLEQYRETVLALAGNPDRLSRAKQRLRTDNETGEVFSAERRVREIETAYEMIWQRHLAGLPPESFDVPPLETRHGN